MDFYPTVRLQFGRLSGSCRQYSTRRSYVKRALRIRSKLQF